MTEGKDWTIETHMRVTREMEIGGNEMLRNQRNHTQEIKLQIRQVKQEVTNEHDTKKHLVEARKIHRDTRNQLLTEMGSNVLL